MQSNINTLEKEERNSANYVVWNSKRVKIPSSGYFHSGTWKEYTPETIKRKLKHCQNNRKKGKIREAKRKEQIERHPTYLPDVAIKNTLNEEGNFVEDLTLMLGEKRVRRIPEDSVNEF